MTILGKSELFGCHFFGCVGYRRDYLGFFIEETIRYTIVLLLRTIFFRLQGLLLT